MPVQNCLLLHKSNYTDISDFKGHTTHTHAHAHTHTHAHKHTHKPTYLSFHSQPAKGFTHHDTKYPTPLDTNLDVLSRLWSPSRLPSYSSAASIPLLSETTVPHFEQTFQAAGRYTGLNLYTLGQYVPGNSAHLGNLQPGCGSSTPQPCKFKGGSRYYTGRHQLGLSKSTKLPRPHRGPWNSLLVLTWTPALFLFKFWKWESVEYKQCTDKALRV